MKVAVVGCSHGELDEIYAAVEEIEHAASTKVDLLICCGDFQAVRNLSDLDHMACPPKYRDLRTFWKYYTGLLKARVPTVFIGGNHEASNHLQEIPLGGLVAPDIYYLGNAGVITFRGLRIAGISGVYVDHNFAKPRNEHPPYRFNQIKTVYHTRKEDADRLMRLSAPVDVFLSHDWPRGIVHHGHLDRLLAAKPFLASEIQRNTFGSPASMRLLQKLRPRYWFSAHVHVKFPALVKHEGDDHVTKFLALDKVIPGRDFIQLLDITPQAVVPATPATAAPATTSVTATTTAIASATATTTDVTTSDAATDANHSSPAEEAVVRLDEEWLAVLHTHAANPSRTDAVTRDEINTTVARLAVEQIPLEVRMQSDFVRTAPPHGTDGSHERRVFTLQSRSTQLMSALGCGAAISVPSPPPPHGEEPVAPEPKGKV